MRLDDSDAEDRLIRAMRKGSPILDELPSASFQQLIQVARDMRLASAASAIADPETQRTLPVTSTEDVHQRIDFLDPPLEPDDLGRLGPYRVRRVVGHGGMGVLFEAIDPRLGRTVALKVILDSRLLDPRYQARFQSEATALARLQHPNIVQIHEVGQHHSRPYFALEYVAGGSLAEFLNARPQPIRDCATLIRTLAVAVQYAHEQGIVHRDLKPANVLVSKASALHVLDVSSNGHESNSWEFSVVKIADFGLARRMEEPGLTQTGEVLGTPGYMAPELIRGSGTSGGPAVDIYALGAMLYVTLTGRPPFQGESLLDTLEQVRTLDPIAPRRLRPSVPRDLETICLTSLHSDPAHRYRSAQDMADDLTRYLEGRPISARPVGWVERLQKAIRRRPAVASLVALAGIMLIGATGGALYHNVQLREQVERADSEASRAVQEKDRADQQYQEAYATLIKMLDSFDERGTAAIPQVVELRRMQSEHILAFLERIVATQLNPNPGQRADLASACKEAARLQIILGRNADAEKNLYRAVHLLEEMDVEGRDDPRELGTLAACCDYLGVLLGQQPSKGQEAVSCGQKAVALMEQLVLKSPEDPRLKYNLAQCCDNLGTLYRTHPGGSVVELYERSLNLLREIHGEQPDRVEFAISLAQTCSNLGPVYAVAQQLDKASAIYQEALAILEPVATDQPDNKYYAFSLAALRINLGGLWLANARGTDGLQQYTLALDSLREILRREPNYSPAQAHLLPAHGGRAQALSQLGRHAEAVQEWDQVVKLASPDQLAGFRLLRAHVLVAAGMFDKAAAEVDEVAREEPSAAVIWYEAGNVQAQIAFALAEEPSRAEPHASQAMLWLQKAYEGGFFDDPANAAYLKSPAFSGIESRPDFQNLLRETQARATP